MLLKGNCQSVSQSVSESLWWHQGHGFALQAKPMAKSCLLRRLQGQTLPNANPPTGKIHPSSKMFATFELIMQL